MYQFDIQTPAGTILYSLPFESIKVTEELNKGLDGQLSMPYQSIKRYTEALKTTPDGAISSQRMEWYLKKNGVPVYGGILLNRTIAGGREGATSYQIKFADFIARLAKRRTATLFQRLATEQIDIVKDLLDAANAEADTGLTIGNDPGTTGKDRDLTSRIANVRDEIVSMSNEKKAGGYDFDTDVTKKLNLYFPTKGESKLGVVFDSFNIVSWQSNRPLEGQLTNKLYTIGQGIGDDQVSATSENVTSQTPWGLLEDIRSEKNVSSVSELQDRGDAVIDDLAFPEDTISIVHKDDSPDITSYNVGDVVRVIIDDISFNKELRIVKRTIQISESGEATVNLSFEGVTT